MFQLILFIAQSLHILNQRHSDRRLSLDYRFFFFWLFYQHRQISIT